MYELSRVQIVDGLHYLKEDKMFVNFPKDVILDGRAQIRLHKFKGYVDVASIFRFVKRDDLDDVWVIQFLKVFYLAVGPLRIGGVSESFIYLF